MKNLKEKGMTVYRYTFYADKNNLRQLYLDKENKLLKGVGVDISAIRDKETKTVEEEESRYKITWYDISSSGLGAYGVAQKVYSFWEEYIEEHNMGGAE